MTEHQALVNKHQQLLTKYNALVARCGSAESLFKMLCEHLKPELTPDAYLRMQHTIDAVLATRSTGARMETAARQEQTRIWNQPRGPNKYDKSARR